MLPCHSRSLRLHDRAVGRTGRLRDVPAIAGCCERPRRQPRSRPRLPLLVRATTLTVWLRVNHRRARRRARQAPGGDWLRRLRPPSVPIRRGYTFDRHVAERHRHASRRSSRPTQRGRFACKTAVTGFSHPTRVSGLLTAVVAERHAEHTLGLGERGPDSGPARSPSGAETRAAGPSNPCRSRGRSPR